MKRKYYFYQFFSEFMPIYPLYALMFQNHGLSIFHQVDMKLPLLCSILNSAITIGIVISFEEKNLFMNKKQEVGILRQMLEDTRFFRKKRDVHRVLCISLLIVGVCEVLDEYDQLIVSNLGFTLTFIGIWAAIRGVFEGVGSLVAAWVRSGFERVFHITKRHQMITILGVVAVSFLGASAYLHQSWSICLYAGYYFLIAICLDSCSMVS